MVAHTQHLATLSFATHHGHYAVTQQTPQHMAHHAPFPVSVGAGVGTGVGVDPGIGPAGADRLYITMQARRHIHVIS